MNESARLPESVSKWMDPFVLCAVVLGVYAVVSPLAVSTLTLSITIVIAAIVVMGLLEWFRSTKPAIKYSLRDSLPYAFITWLGTLGGLAIVVLAWGTLTEYQSAYYGAFFQTLPLIIVFAPVVSALFILAAYRVRGPSIHGGYQLGLVLIGRMREVDWYLLRDDLLSWFIRGFFLPINFCELVLSIDAFRGQEFSLLNGSWVAGEYYLLLMIYALIVATVTPGYLFGSRLINTETKAISSSWFAWTVTLACYSPFEAVFFLNLFDYNPSSPDPSWMQPWVTHMGNIPFLLGIVGSAILLFSLVHLWAEAQFGIRSSNLSNRGIITTGAYRFCKHPVYFTKCAVWFLIWMPFLSGVNIVDDVRLTVLWLCVCGLYMLRCLAEEKLLADDPAYVAYALWMDEHGSLKGLGKMFPPLCFSWRLAYWQKSAISGAKTVRNPTLSS